MSGWNWFFVGLVKLEYHLGTGTSKNGIEPFTFLFALKKKVYLLLQYINWVHWVHINKKLSSMYLGRYVKVCKLFLGCHTLFPNCNRIWKMLEDKPCFPEGGINHKWLGPISTVQSIILSLQEGWESGGKTSGGLFLWPTMFILFVA